jgi:chromosome segregation ATPase
MADRGDEFRKRLHLVESEIDGLMRRKVNASTSDSTGRVLDYDQLINEKENQIVELEKKVQNFEEKLRRAARREGELEDEVARLTAAIKAVNTPNVSKAELERLSIGAVQFASLEEKYNRLRGQLQSFGSLYKTQIDKLRTSGVKLENESTLDSLLRSEGIQTSFANGVVNII